MDWINTIEKSIEYLEKNILENLNPTEIADLMLVPVYEFEKMFTIMTGVTFKEYVKRRRLTLAGYELFESSISILDLAIKYGYNSNESFTRAFSRFHGVTPSAVKKGSKQIRSFIGVSVKDYLTGGKRMMNDLNKRGYMVKETGAVYFTPNMDETLSWFKNVLGWYGQIDARDNESVGMYGCVNSIPTEIEMLHIAPFTGIHLFHGEVNKQLTAFMLVDNVEKLHKYVLSKGWKKITPIIHEAWGGKTCLVTTIDGCELKFFEIIK